MASTESRAVTNVINRGPYTLHELKIWPTFFRDIVSGSKNFDVRKGEDRCYLVGDVLCLREWDPIIKLYTGNSVLKRVCYVLHGGEWLPPDTWILGLAPGECGSISVGAR